MKYTVKLLEIGKPDRMKRVYTKECAEAIIDYIENTPSGVFVEPARTVDEFVNGAFMPSIPASCGIVRSGEIKDDELFIDFETFNVTPHGRILEGLIGTLGEQCFTIAPRGIGNVDENGIISPYTFLGFDLILNKE